MDPSTTAIEALAPRKDIPGLTQQRADIQCANDTLHAPPTVSLVNINILQLSIVCDGRVLVTRSRALLVFVCCLVRQKRAQPNAPWIGIDALRSSLPSVHGKQMQRFIDALATIGFPISYESKTRGRYCLDSPATLVKFDVDERAQDAFIGAPRDGHLPSIQPLVSPTADGSDYGLAPAQGCDDLLNALSKISRADAQFHDGNLDSDIGHAYELWRRLIETAEPEIKATALLKFARVCRRLQRYGEALGALRKLRQMVHAGEIAGGALEYKALLCLATMRYEQGRANEARAIVDRLDMHACTDDAALGEYYNLQGLLAAHAMTSRHQAARAEHIAPTALPASLKIAEQYYRQALTLTARTNDYQSLQGVCFNFGSLYVWTYQFKFPVADRDQLLDLGIRWIAQCEFICSKFGVGMDSLRSRIVLLKAALAGRLELSDLNRLCGGLFKNHSDLEGLALATLRETVRVGIRTEQALTLGVLAQIAQRKGDAAGLAEFTRQALDLYRQLNRADLIRRLKDDLARKAA